MKQKTKQLQSSGETRKTNRTWHFLSTLNSLLLSKLLLLLIIPAIGSTAAWGENATNNPATVSYGTGDAAKTFLDVANTVSNATIKEGNVACVTYGLYEMGKNWKPAFYTGTENGSSSSYSYTNATDFGFMAGSSAGTGTAANKSATSGYGAAKYTSTATAVIYVTGITGIAVMGKDNKTSDEKILYIKVEEYASDGTLTTVGTTKSSGNTDLHITPFDAGTLVGSKYYKVTLTSGNTGNCETSQIRFTKGSATAYTVTFNAGSNGTCETTSLKEAEAGAGVTLPEVTPNSGYAFKGWYTAETSGSKVGDAGATYKPSADTPLYAQYDQLYNIATSAATGGTVTVDKSSAIEGASVIVTASPSSNYVLDAIQVTKTTGGEDVTTSVLSGNTITMPAYNITVSATFNKVVESTATFTLDELKEFGGPSGGDHSTHQSYINGGITLATSSNNVQGQGSSDGTKVRYTGSFTITPATGKKITEVTLVTKQSNRSLTASPATSEAVSRTSTTYTYKFNNVAEAITFTNNNSSNIYVTYITVKYTTEGSASQTQLTGTFANDVMIYTNEEPVKPTLTVNADASYYTVSYASSNTNVVTVDSDNGTLSKVSDGAGGYKSGNAIITATLTPTSAGIAANYIEGSASYTVAIYALRDLNITIPSVQMNSTDATQSNPTVTVYTTDGSGNTIELSSSDYTVAYTVVEDQDYPNNIIASASSTITVNGSTKNWKVGTATLRATITPTSSIISTYHVKETSYKFTYTVVNATVKWKPTIVYSDGIKVNVNSKLTVKPYVMYNDVDITDGFDLSYSLDAGSATGTAVDATGVITAGSTSGTATLTISAAPTEDYAEQYDAPNNFTVTINVAELQDLTLSSIANQTVAVGNTINTPAYTVSAGGIQLGDDEFDVAYYSSSPSIAYIDRVTGMITGLADGTATITVFITKDGYKDGRITFDVIVEDGSTFKVSKSGTYNEFDILRNESGTLQVTLGGWNFPNEISNWNSKYGTTSEKSSAKWSKLTSGTKPAGYEALASGFEARNPRNENGSNCQPENIHIYDKYIAEKEFVLVDKMFNTPTSGSFLAFCPKVNGTVTARVRQSGCFEYYDNHLRYRPQRRVFIMDEAGNFVESTAKLEATTGSMPKAEESATKNGLNLLNYEYDLDTRSVGKTMAELGNKDEVLALVNSHLGTTLTIDGEGKINNFSNGLYECQLGDDITHNNIAGRGSKSGAKGWVSLVNAPVSYTFNVKAGKTYYLYNFGAKIGIFGFSFKEGASEVDEIDYAQDQASLTATPEGHVAQVNINGLNVKGGQWNSLVLPFSLNQQQVEALFGECYKTGVADGTQILYYDKIENGKIKFVRHAYNNIVAGKPFLIKPKKTDNITINTADIVDFPYVTIESTSVADWGRSSEDYIWAGGYGVLEINPGDYYINGSGNITFREISQAKMHGFHGYLKDKKSTETKQGHSLVLDMLADFSLFDDDEATAIQELRMESDGTIREVPTSGKIYNMNGQLVGTNASKVYSLPAGMYIVNGKKYIVQ